MSYPEQTTGIGVAARLSVNTPSTTLTTKDTHQIAATITDAVGTTVAAVNPIDFVSQNPAVASVSSSGLVTAVAPGNTSVFVTYSPTVGIGFDAEVSIYVSPDYPTAPPFSWLRRHRNGTEWVGEDVYPT